MAKKEFIIPHKGNITKKDRQRQKGHKSVILWFTGLSGSGKSTLAHAVEEKLFEMGIHTYVLDGDNIRTGLNKDLGFSAEDREENIRRIGEVAKLFVDAGIITLTAFISPYKKDRNFVRNLVEEKEFVEIYVKCPLEVCEQRDVKGLYKKARAGIIKNFTGIDDPYEEPENPEIVVETDKESVEESVEKIISYLKEKGYLEVE
ncbi:adenylyl-sulfate kinase [Persephonella sp. IF05-L8]|uniref:adenylyl-sulfate kinase n=1 Tax=Persephonella sp. IF05-L8 TaxID=1158338 RepID=UPI0004953A57